MTDVNLLLFSSKFVQAPKPEKRLALSDTLIQEGEKARGRPALPFNEPTISTSHGIQSPLHLFVLPVLEKRGLLCDALLSGVNQWRGIARVVQTGDSSSSQALSNFQPNHYTRLQITFVLIAESNVGANLRSSLVPSSSRGSGLLFLTGDIEFIKYMRAAARKHGLYLNEFGLWKWVANDEQEDGGDWEQMKSDTEADIFASLGMDFVEPGKRNFSYLTGKSERRRSI